MVPGDTPFWLAFLIVGGAMSVMVALRYFMASGAFAWITAKAHPGLYSKQRGQIAMEIRYSLIAAVIYGVPAGIVFWLWRHHGYTLIYTEWNAYPLWYLPVSVLLYLFAQDTWFYWTHRAMHHWPTLFKLAHKVHHDSKPPTVWTAMSFHPLESVSGAIVIPVLVFLVPIHLAMLGVVLSVATVMGVINHMGWEIFPRSVVHSPFGAGVITASHHERHHEDYRCNYGLYFRFWDRLCGTDHGLSRRFARNEKAQEDAAVLP
ncbi:sterol desaturase family protein [Erythrobacter sp. SCSIO 43205]|uniref:sterol desaturase family protein n=1 Tax=Erythrobacter sp. SCSIO 43205 TaxID=2779361 RepID=UPI001CA98618|nr:sterol desaturase family protein [Erythrobacter sp. SCSIO 43205]UAB78410.1 sterol desaturase family protein [Erythrobacter sp. SCSIO 43205]